VNDGEGGSKQLVSIAAAGRLLGISTPGVRRLIRSSQLPTVEVGDAVRIAMPVIDRLVNGPEQSDGDGGGSGEVRADILAMLDELRVGQAQLLEEVNNLRGDVATLAEKTEMGPADESMHTVREVADLLRVSPSVVYGWSMGTAGPPAIRVGRSLRFRRADILEWLDSKRQQSPDWRLELETRPRAETARSVRTAQLRSDRHLADAPGLVDNVAVAVTLNIPVATVDGWRITGRGPRWARVGGVVRYLVNDVRTWLVEERELQAKRSDRRYRRIDCDAALKRLGERAVRRA
jgi:excisionase family DNA binding protein